MVKKLVSEREKETRRKCGEERRKNEKEHNGEREEGKEMPEKRIKRISVKEKGTISESLP